MIFPKNIFLLGKKNSKVTVRMMCSCPPELVLTSHFKHILEDQGIQTATFLKTVVEGKQGYSP